MPQRISENVRRLLREDLDGYDQLEILLALRRKRDDSWDLGKIGEAVGLPTVALSEPLTHLTKRGLIESRGETWSYKPRDAGVAATIDELAAAYDDERRVHIMRIMNANAIQRLRTSAVRAFADAFVVGGKDDEDG